MSCCGNFTRENDLAVTITMAADLVTLDKLSRAVYKLGDNYYFDLTDKVIEQGYTIIQVLQ